MTEKSYFFDGTTLGDAQQAPYSSDKFAEILDLLYGSQMSFVFPFTTGYFRVDTTGADMVITVNAGNALVQGRYFTCTNTNFTVPLNTSSLPRIDRMVVRIDKVNSTGRLALKQGVPGYAPPPAEITQNDDIYEMSVARIYVPSGITALSAYHVIDEREYYGAVYSSLDIEAFNENIMPNSEFIAGAGTSYDTAPACWSVINTGTCTRVPKFEQQSRGSGVKVTCPASGDGIQTTVDRLTNDDPLPYVIRLLINVVAGEININTTGSGHRIPATNGPIEFIERRTMTNAARSLNINITSTTPNTEFILGQVTVSPGYTGAPYLPKRELILFGKPLTQVAYPTGYITGTTEIALITDLSGVSSLVTRLDVSDGSSGGTNTCYAALQDITSNANQLRLEVGRLTNAGRAGTQGFISAPHNSAGEQKLQVEVSSPATMDVGIYQLGCIT